MASNDENGPLRKCRRTAPRAQQARASQSSEQASSLEQWLQRAFAWGHVSFEEAFSKLFFLSMGSAIECYFAMDARRKFLLGLET